MSEDQRYIIDKGGSEVTGDTLVRVCIELAIKSRDAHNSGTPIEDGGVLTIMCRDKVILQSLESMRVLPADKWIEGIVKLLTHSGDVRCMMYVGYLEYGVGELGDEDFIKLFMKVECVNDIGEFCMLAMPIQDNVVACEPVIFMSGFLGMKDEEDTIFLEACSYYLGYKNKKVSELQ